MDDNKASVLQDNQGNTSSMRVMCFLSLLTAIGLAFVHLSKGPQPNEGFPTVGLVLVFLFLIGAFVPKGYQKLIELKFGKVSDEIPKP